MNCKVEGVKMLKRVMTIVIGIGIIAAVFLLDSFQLVNCPLFFNIAIAIISLMMTYEFYEAVEKKDIHPIKYLGYIASLAIIPIGLVKTEIVILLYSMLFPLLIFAGFLESLRTNIKYNIVDIGVTVFGALYTVFLTSFLVHTRAMDNGNGVWYVWFIFGGAWITDSFAFLIGKAIGKHKVSKISPKKSLEGCIGGLIGGIVFFLIFTKVLQSLQIAELNYFIMGIVGCIVSLISQIGDFSASSIKRYCEIKDFSDLMPGHGGMLDRFDSILFVAPVVYFVLAILI